MNFLITLLQFVRVHVIFLMRITFSVDLKFSNLLWGAEDLHCKSSCSRIPTLLYKQRTKELILNFLFSFASFGFASSFASRVKTLKQIYEEGPLANLRHQNMWIVQFTLHAH